MMWQSNDQTIDIYRSLLKSGLHMMNKGLGHFERLQDYQADALKDMRAGHSELSKQLTTPGSVEELQAIQAELARSQMMKLVTFWSALCTTTWQYQTEILSEAQVNAGEVAREISDTLEAAPVAAVPVLSALKLVLGTAETTLAVTARATEGIARITAGQMEAAKETAARKGNGAAKQAG